VGVSLALAPLWGERLLNAGRFCAGADDTPLIALAFPEIALIVLTLVGDGLDRRRIGRRTPFRNT
jgi:hypothetical protein